ncbi:MAG TPA: methyltransferase, partial [Tepidisphaeraceae bacterium]|nr:methyltransferase [Tepidisphaeraceae bacterium]
RGRRATSWTRWCRWICCGETPTAPTATARRPTAFLDKHKPAYIGGILKMANHRLYRLWEQCVQENNFAARFSFLAGNFFTDPIPAADVVIMGHILYDWDLQQWMRQVGFRDTRVEHLCGPDSMVVGIK